MDQIALLTAIGAYASVMTAATIALAARLGKASKRLQHDAMREEAHTSLLACNADLKAQLRSADEYAAKLLRELIPLREADARRKAQFANLQAANRARNAAKSNGNAHA